jgi:lipopolysaccharide/colanic/teichoic acid biosynthesis glycosyltransferase
MMSIENLETPMPRWMATVSPALVRKPWVFNYASAKAAVDGFTALLLLGLLWPVLVVLMVLVRLTSRGPALYKQTRVGLGGTSYTIIKLRTMYHECERGTGPRWSTPGDPRVTGLGRWLRRTHLDELPQLWNVLCGHMSLVGPRPERPEFVEQLECVIPGYRERLSVRPGITGLAQIQLPPDEEVAGVRRKVAYDTYYVQRAGAWLDVRIVAGTALKVFGVPFETIRLVLALPGPDAVAVSAR